MEKPILFNTQTVQALLERRKTTTRRIVKDVEGMEYDRKLINGNMIFKSTYLFTTKYEVKAPYKVGDILYVRETWQEWTGGYAYKVGGDYPKSFIDKWKPSIHMPKAAARIFLKVTDVRVERLQDITEEECIKEGVEPLTDGTGYKFLFSVLWDSTVNKKQIDMYGWDANPWVWVIEFERIDKKTI